MGETGSELGPGDRRSGEVGRNNCVRRSYQQLKDLPS